MVLERDSFGLSVVGNQLLATGGVDHHSGPISSVEVFTEGGWRMEVLLEMRATKFYHCSIAIGTWLYTIGGFVGGDSFDDDESNLVEAFDTSLLSTSRVTWDWVQKASMLEKRSGHGCHIGLFEGDEGVFVAGGTRDYLASAEFYNPTRDVWQAIGSLNTGRTFSPMTMLGERLIVSGGDRGYEHLTSVEAWDGLSWVELNNLNLEVGRVFHAAVSVKAGQLNCILDK